MHVNKRYYMVVDGYNVINSWEILKDAGEISLDNARQSLLDMMAELAKITGEKIIVVFDSYLQKNPTRQHYSHKGVEIVYTKEFETADNYIERFVNEAKKNDIIKVASSDATIQTITFGKGASRISSRELYNYYINSKKNLIRRSDIHLKKGSKAIKNIVSIEGDSLALIEELERKMSDKDL